MAPVARGGSAVFGLTPASFPSDVESVVTLITGGVQR